MLRGGLGTLVPATIGAEATDLQPEKGWNGSSHLSRTLVCPDLIACTQQARSTNKQDATTVVPLGKARHIPETDAELVSPLFREAVHL